MPQPSNPVFRPAPATGDMVQFTQLPLQSRQLLWLMRLFIAVRLDYTQVQRPLAATAPHYSRAIPILLCHFLYEVSRFSVRRVQVAGPCHAAITEDEVRFLAAADLAQMQDPRLASLLAQLCGLPEESPDLAPILCALQKLGMALLQEGMRVEACHLLNSDALPAIH